MPVLSPIMVRATQAWNEFDADDHEKKHRQSLSLAA